MDDASSGCRRVYRRDENLGPERDEGATCGIMRKSEADRAHEGWPRNVAKFDITWDHASMSFLEADPGTA